LNAEHFYQPSVNRTVKMKNLLLTVLAFGLLSSSAFAEEGLGKKQFSRVVASETNQRIGFFYAVNPDCTASGNVNVRMTKKTRHGRDNAYNPFSQFPKRRDPFQMQSAQG
jgi:hypothetical protein